MPYMAVSDGSFFINSTYPIDKVGKRRYDIVVVRDFAWKGQTERL